MDEEGETVIDQYTLRNLLIFCYPVCGYFIYKYWKWHKLTPIITYTLCLWVLFTIPYAKYAQKPFLIKKVIEIYHQKKSQEYGIVYHKIPIMPRGYTFYSPHPHLKGFPDMKAVDMVFRILIWQDAISELWRDKAIFGEGLSKPFRSPQLEKLHWAEEEWRKDGFIMFHNSYLFLIYRTGIIGIFLIFCLFLALRQSWLAFIQLGDTCGILLLCVVWYWSSQATFQLQWEYWFLAIPYWSTIGLILNRRKNVTAVTR